jgi:hypothetical protein
MPENGSYAPFKFVLDINVPKRHFFIIITYLDNKNKTFFCFMHLQVFTFLLFG